MSDEDDHRFVDVGALPDEPLSMPPPYWRSSSAIFHVRAALRSLPILLARLVKVHAHTDSQLGVYFAKHPQEPADDDGDFGGICEKLWDLEHRIKLATEVACFMSAIVAEDMLNRFCVYNLHKDLAEPLESLAPADKLVVAAAAVGKPGARQSPAFEALKKLYSWRNAFAHGHCTDRPTKSLRHNHLIPPKEYPGVPSSIEELRRLVGGLVRIEGYLCSISRNPYTSRSSSEVSEIQALLKKMEKYQFVGNNTIYQITVTVRN
jgi:hypothetical protein